MVNEFDADRRLSAANPITDDAASSLMPPELNEIVIARIIEAKTPRRPLRVEMARIGFLGVLAACGFVLVAVNLWSDGGTSEIAPAIEATPVEPPVGPTTTVLEVLQATTLASSTTVAETVTSQTAKTTQTTAAETETDSGPPPSAQSDPSATTPEDPEATIVEEAAETTSTTAAPTEQEIPAVESPPEDSDPVPMLENPSACVAFGETRRDAIDAYEMECAEPRVDCDPFTGYWACASDQIGEYRP